MKTAAECGRYKEIVMKKAKMLTALFVCLCLLATTFLTSCVDNNNGGGEITLTGISITKLPDTVTYYEGDTFNKAGMVVTANYSDGTSSEIKTYSVDKTVLSADDTLVTVTYRDKSASVSVVVNKVTLKSLTVTRSPDKTAYFAGETFDKAGMVVSAGYSDGKTRTITDYSVTSAPLTVGDDHVTVTYGGLSATVAISVTSIVSATVSLFAAPIKKVYVEGEKFDPTGILFKVESGDTVSYTSEISFADDELCLGVTEVEVSCLKNSFSVGVSVVGGQAMSFVSSYSDDDYDSVVDDIRSKYGVTDTGNDLHNGFNTVKQLAEPYPDGVSNIDEFVEQADYHIFYNIESFVIKVDFYYGDIENLLDKLYLNSGLLSSSASVKGQALENGYVQVVVKYYTKSFFVTSDNSAPPTFAENSRRASLRGADHTFDTVDASGVTVYNTDQAIYALTHGYKISPVGGTRAEATVNKAVSILNSVCDDDMDEFEKMYCITAWFMENAAYDHVAEESADLYCLDIEYESDMISSLFASYYAEGPLMYGTAVCYGYAKAYALLLAIEGIDVTRVVAQHKNHIGGRSSFIYENGGYSYYIHSYNYVKIDGCDYLSDVTYAYAGSWAVDSKEVTIYRNMCLAMTKNEHLLVYTSLTGDKISSSANYNPASYNYLSEYTYDGANSYMITSAAQADDYFEKMMIKIAEGGSGYYYLPMFVKANVFGYNNNAAISYLENKLNEYAVPRWYRLVYRSVIGGEDCYNLLVVMKF